VGLSRDVRLWAWGPWLLGALVGGCTIGSGEGEVRGTVTALSCGLDGADYDLQPTFFGSSPVEEQLEIRVQRGSDLEGKSDGIAILVADAALVRGELLGTQLPFEEGGMVRMNVYLNGSCPVDRRHGPVNYEAVSGSILFDNIYAPLLTEDDNEVAARFEDVLLVDPVAAETRNALLSGHFRFLHNRGRPAQRFP